MSNRRITLPEAAAAAAELAIRLTSLTSRNDLPALFSVRFYDWYIDYPAATALLDIPNSAGDANHAVIEAIQTWADVLGTDVRYAAPDSSPLRPAVMRQRISATRKYDSGARFTVYHHVYMSATE